MTAVLEVVSSTPRPHFTPGKDPEPILQEAGWAIYKYFFKNTILLIKTKPCLAGNPVYTQPRLTEFTSILTHSISESLFHTLNITEFWDV
jgi:hypothetical protein